MSVVYRCTVKMTIPSISTHHGTLSNPSLLWPSLPTPTERNAGDVLLCVPPQSAHVDRQLQQSVDQHWCATVQCVGVHTYMVAALHAPSSDHGKWCHMLIVTYCSSNRLHTVLVRCMYIWCLLCMICWYNICIC